MRKIVLSSFWVCCCYFCISIGNTGHAEELATTRPLLVASSKPVKSITIDGVEYVPKVKDKKKLAPLDMEEKEVKEVKEDETGKSSFSDFFAGSKNGNLENFEMKGKVAVGLEVSLVNLGIGPTVEYWFTDNIAVLAHYSGLADFQTIGVRGEYLFNKPFKIYNNFNTKPYVGIGYSSVKYTGGPIEAKGSGADFHAGILTSAQYIAKNLMMRLEAGYSTTKLEIPGKTIDTGFGTITSEKTPVPGWGGFGIAYGLYYYF